MGKTTFKFWKRDIKFDYMGNLLNILFFFILFTWICLKTYENIWIAILFFFCWIIFALRFSFTRFIFLCLGGGSRKFLWGEGGYPLVIKNGIKRRNFLRNYSYLLNFFVTLTIYKIMHGFQVYDWLYPPILPNT